MDFKVFEAFLWSIFHVILHGFGEDLAKWQVFQPTPPMMNQFIVVDKNRRMRFLSLRQSKSLLEGSGGKSWVGELAYIRRTCCCQYGTTCGFCRSSSPYCTVFRGSDWVKGLQYEVYSNLYWEVSIGFRQTTNYQCSMYAVIGWKAKEYYCRIFQNRCSKGNHQYVSQKEATHHHWRILLQDIQFPLQTLAFF